jgi:hypothetical protein
MVPPDEAPSSSEQNWEFISVTGGNLRGDAPTRRRVRSHAMADYRRRNPPCRWTRTVELDTTPLLDGPPQWSSASPPEILHQQEALNLLIQTEAVPHDDISMETELYSCGRRQLGGGLAMSSSMSGFISPGPVTLFDASRSDPFGTFPIDRSHRSRELWDHCKRDNRLRNLDNFSGRVF